MPSMAALPSAAGPQMDKHSRLADAQAASQQPTVLLFPPGVLAHPLGRSGPRLLLRQQGSPLLRQGALCLCRVAVQASAVPGPVIDSLSRTLRKG